ncbi:MAG: XRE family transcriptional regulator [Alphaproteobacteria bacterium]|nr:XRE family transcriptional regulator [Alphaproteobacteria bacterium]
MDKESDGVDRVIDSTGNVFDDLGLPSSDSHMLKVRIAMAITATVNKAKLTQKDVAKILVTDQAKVSAILRGRLKEFSVERLIFYLLRLGHNVEIRVARRNPHLPGAIKVVAA